MLRGEFHRADGLVIPNNITTYGASMLFRWALIGDGYDLYMGLANCNPSLNLAIEDLNEPTLGVNGYLRQQIERSGAGWPIFGNFNGESYYETAVHIFAAAAPGFDKPINRLALINSNALTTGTLVVALSAPLPDELTITDTTPADERSFKYRIYGR